MAKKKLTTQEILAAARAEAAGKSGKPEGAPAAAEESPAPEQDVSEEPVGKNSEAADDEPAAPARPAARPKSTKDILAAARGQAAGKSGDGGSAQARPAKAESKPQVRPQAADSAGGAERPKSTRDILAAARAQAGGAGTGATAATKPKGPKPTKKASPKSPAATKSAGERPSVQEMLKAVREGKPLDKGEPAAAKPRLPRAPKKPAAPRRPVADREAEGQTRRSALLALLAAPLTLLAQPFSAAWTLFTAATGIFTLALARFMMPNVLVEPPSKFKIGAPSDYPAGTVSTKWKSEYGIWVTHTNYNGQSMIYALISVCTHLGCTPNWLEGEQKFKCPCHGSGFYITGVNFEGPAPRPLERAGIRLAPDGMLEVDKSVKFQEEMGQWNDPASFLPVV